MFETLIRALGAELPESVAIDVPMAPLTTFGIGGRAAVMVSPRSFEAIRVTLVACREHGVPLYVLGAGSNLIVPDEGLPGVVLRLAGALDGIRVEGDLIVAQAGVGDARLAEFALEHRLAGFEWIYDIPGSVGGAVYMNAGNNDGEISHSVVEVRWMSPDGQVHTTAASGLELGYRTSLFQHRPGIILEARLRPSGGDESSAIRGRMDAIRALRQSKFPEETLCAGSIFKRPPGHYAGKLIEDAGCGGMRVGGALVSHKHKGFIVNTGGATAHDVLALIEQVKERVFQESGVRLTTEVQRFAPFFSPAVD